MTTRPKEHLRPNRAKTRTETNHAIPLSGESESLTRACRSEIGGMPMTDAKRMLSVIELCHRYGIGKTMAYAEMAAGRLPFVKRGRRRLIPVDGAEAWAAPTQALNAPSAVDREGTLMQRSTLRSRAVTARNRRLAEKALEIGIRKIRGAAAGTATAVSNDVARELEVSLLVASVGHDVDRAIAVIRAGVNAGLRSPSPPKYFEKLGPNSRIATATHEAGHAARAKMLGRRVNFVEIYPEQVCNAGMSQDLRERIQFSLGGYCAEYWLHGVGEKYPDGLLLEEALWAALGGETMDHGDIAHALVDILKLLPGGASEEQIFAELKHHMDICYEMLKIPGARAGLERIAVALAEREHLTGNEVDRAWLGKR